MEAPGDGRDWAIATGMALLVSVARQLRVWDQKNLLIRSIGEVLCSIAGALTTGFLLRSYFLEDRNMWIAAVAISAWGGTKTFEILFGALRDAIARAEPRERQ